MSDRRIKEWASARYLVHKLSGRSERAICKKDEFGKPYLEDSNYCISISHSQNRTAVIAAPYNVGIDIQEIVPKMDRIAKKFMRDDEWSFMPINSLDSMHVIWGAKEAMYKAYGRKGIDFKLQMQVDSFDWNGSETITKGRLQKANITMFFDVVAEKIEQYMLVYVIEKFRTIE